METVVEPITAQTLSLSHGPALRDDSSLLVSLAAALKRAAERSPSKGVRYIRSDGTDLLQTYTELVAEASKILGGLRAAGLKPGEKVIFQLHQNEDFVPAFWACAMGGLVPVPISIPPGYDEPHNTLAKLQNAWTMLERPVVLANTALAPGLQSFAQRMGLAGFRVQVIEPLRTAAPSSDWHQNQPDDLALLLLTSGSTGMPKGVQLSHRNILSRSAATAQFDEFNADDVSLNWMPLDHVGGLVMYHIRDVYLACSQIQAPTDLVLQNPLTWLDWMQQYRVSITWAPNFAFGLINDQAPAIAQGSWDLSSMRFILNGGEAIVSKTARRFLTLLAPHGLPGTAMRPAWGMSETSSGVTSSHRFTLDQTSDGEPFVEVGGPLPTTSIRIVDRQNSPEPEGKIGSLQIKGASITSGYFNNPQLNAEVFTPDGWFITGDLGVLKEGRLTITGREKDVIIVNGVNFHSHEIESVVEGVDDVEVSFVAACPIRLSGENTDRIAIFFSPSPRAADRLPALVKAIRSAVVKKEGVNPDYVIPVTKEAIPKTAIGKIQRNQLKQQFERGDFAELAAKYSVQGAEAAGGLNWFYRPAWRDAAVAAGAIPSGSVFWLFADTAGLTPALAKELSAAGHTTVLIEQGIDFIRSSTTSFTISAGNLEHYTRLVAEAGRLPDYIVHAWTLGGGVSEPASVAELEVAQRPGAYSLLGLVKALARAGVGERSVRMLVASSETRAVADSDRIAYSKTPVLGLVRTIPQELAWLDCKHVDFDLTSPEVGTRHVLAELQGWDKASESAWRAGLRKVPCLEKAEPSEKPRELPFVRGGLYLITGGIGGIGLRFAGHLLQHFDARLLIVGRSALPARNEWPKIIAAGGSQAERIRALQALEMQGGAFEYVATDVSDAHAMQSVLASAEKKWSRPLDGVLHIAGIYHEALLENETVAGLAAVMCPKVLGTWVLHQLAVKRPGCLFINFSSLISFFGSLSTGAYAAANNFLDAFSHHQRHACGLKAYNLLWSSWTDIGMSRGYDAGEALRSRGYLSIAAEQGVESLLFALRNDQPQLLVGVDGSNKAIQRYFHPDAVVGATTPLTDSGSYVAPRTEVEKQIAKIWQTILNVPQVGLKDNFFELGGRSLLAAKMFAQIHKALGKNLPIPVLFKAPTIEQLTLAFLEQAKSSAIKITALQPVGSRPTLFLIPESGFDGSVFQELAQKLGTEQPSFGLQAKALTAAVPSNTPLSIEETAKLFAEEIVVLAPTGPCAVGGRGFGGVLAWETARVLKAKGRTVSLIALVEPPPAGFFSREGGASQLRLIKPAATGGFLGKLFKKGPAEDAAITKELRQARERYSDASLAAANGPVAVFGDENAALIWRDFSPTGFTRFPVQDLAERLSGLIAK